MGGNANDAVKSLEIKTRISLKFAVYYLMVLQLIQEIELQMKGCAKNLFSYFQDLKKRL
jgi:hypothetical protein